MIGTRAGLSGSKSSRAQELRESVPSRGAEKRLAPGGLKGAQILDRRAHRVRESIPPAKSTRPPSALD